ncbi:MAG: DUF4345 domain-containing protein [Saprospiraceae bacterium]|nr:DUF4345 domain-containing protein [Saprospiraceae bacterium]
MKVQNWIKIFLLIMAIPTLLVGLTALFDPQAIMDNVDQTLDTISARSSTRAIYGGMHLCFGLFFVYGAFKAQREALLILALYGVGFVIGRLVSLPMDGRPNAFISRFIWIEAITALLSVYFYRLSSKT